MTRKIQVFLLLIFAGRFAFSQTIDSISLDTLLSKSEIVFQDSINALNEENERFANSRREYNSGLDFFEKEKFEDAIKSFTNAIMIDSSFSEAYFYRARCYEGFNDSLSILDYKKSYALDTTNFTPLYRLAKIQSNINLDSAMNTYNFIVALNNQPAQAYYEIGVLYYIKNDLKQAIISFTKSIDIKKDARAFNDRGSCYRLLENNDLAIQDYSSAIDLDPNLAFIYNNLASIYRKNGDTAQALSFYSKAINKEVNYVLAYNNRASLYIDLDEMERALNDIEKAISLDIDYAPAYNNKGVLFHHQKKYNKALLCFDKAILLDNNYAKAYLNRGITRQMTRDEEGACNDWEKANELGIDLANKYFENDCN